MGEFSTKEYFQLSNKIFVPKEWPVKGIETFLVQLAKNVIDSVSSNKFIILQVGDIPTMLTHRQENHETLYFFEKIFQRRLIDSYVIDVVFEKNDNYFVSKANSTDSEDSLSEISSGDTYNFCKEFLLDDYVIFIHQSQNRTTYYLETVEKRTQQHSTQQTKRQKMHYNMLLFLMVIAIAVLIFMILLNKIQFY